MKRIWWVIAVFCLSGVMFGVALSGQAAGREYVDVLGLPEFQEATKNYSPEARFEFAAVLHVSLHQYEQAVAILEALAKRHPDASGLWGLLAKAYNRLGKAREALDTANIAITLEPYVEAYYLERGIASYQLGQDREAVEDLSRHLKSYTTSGMAHFYLGLAHARLEDFPTARDMLTKAGSLNPSLTILTNYHVGLIDARSGLIKEGRMAMEDTLRGLEGANLPWKDLVFLQWVQLLAKEQANTFQAPVFRVLLQEDIQHAPTPTPQPRVARR